MPEYEIGLGLKLLPEVRAYFESHELSISLVAELHEGRYFCTQITATPASGGPPGVTGEVLRDLRLAEMVERCARVAGCEQVISETGKTIISTADGPTDAVLEVVATAYRYGHALGDTPTREVMDLLGLPRSKAARWISMARSNGLLESTRERTPGGAVLERLREHENLSSLERREALVQHRVAEMEGVVDKYQQYLVRSTGGETYTTWVESRIRATLREADKERERLDALRQAIDELALADPTKT